jgi:uncharacterized protein with von Willebrand factor type A (vWA) domain
VDSQRTHHHPFGGVVHTYLGYDPQNFPMPAARTPDVLSAAFDQLMAYGSLDELTPEQLAEAVELDPRQIRGLGPSIDALLELLRQRRQRILETYATDAVRREADSAYRTAAARVSPPAALRQAFDKAVRDEQLPGLERLWYRADQRSDFGRQLVRLMHDLGRKYQVETLAARYAFTGRRDMSVDQALAVKEELETIDRLIAQLLEARKSAKVYIIDMEALARFASDEELQSLAGLRRQVQELLEQLAAEQGLQRGPQGYQLTPKAYRLFQARLLQDIFSELQSSRTGRHAVGVTGDGAVELQRTKAYEFGDSLAHLDVVGSLINAMIRRGSSLPVELAPADMHIHLTRNTPKCATVVCMDMSGSMRWGGQYIHVKRMALALHGLIRKEYPGDCLEFVEICSLPCRRHIAEIPGLMPRPVTVHDPVVRLKADMSSQDITALDVPPHFTNIQHSLHLARQLLEAQDTPNRQIILITDGLPTAHFEGHWLYLLYPPDPRTERRTLREGLLCKQHGIVLNTFLLSSWSQSEDDVHFAHRLAESTGGRVFFVGGRELDRFVVWDYLKRRRYIVG